ncbi:MAG: hypothetical protein KAY24_00225 [Candidatus Eisenbacteria sp.]|nr:hypothetical protein [Candidatus Eisenbacteria bacterium]
MEIWAKQAQEVLRVPLHQHAAGEYAGPCPVCGGKDRFIVFTEGNSWCRRCNHRVWWDDSRQNDKEAIARRAELAGKKQQAAQTMKKCDDWVRYWEACRADDLKLALWDEHGISREEVMQWGLGWCPECPLASGFASLTMPVFYQGTLLDIRHRLLGASPQVGKYRSHMRHLAPSLFNADVLSRGGTTLVVEGEKKAIILSRAHPTVVSIPGSNSGLALLAHVQQLEAGTDIRFLVGLDPSAEEQGAELVGKIRQGGFPAILLFFPEKPDDFLLREGNDAVQHLLRFTTTRFHRNGRGKPIERGKAWLR